jgi:hypothetical protein
MSVAVPIAAPAALTPQLPTLWELGSDLQAETAWIARLSERLDSEDDDERAIAIADLEESLASEHHTREAFTRKADATCWVIERLRAEASYHASQAKRFSALARREDSRADALETTLIHLLSRLEPATLQSLAATTDGRYADASGWVDLAELLRQTVEAGRRGEFKEVNRVRLAERFQFFLAPAVLLLLAGLWREFPVRPTPRPVTLKSASS